MTIRLRKLRRTDQKIFLKWWKDSELIALTSGNFDEPDENLPKYFALMRGNRKDHHYVISLDGKAIGHVALMHKNAATFEITVMIGEKRFWGKGYGTDAIRKAVKIGFEKLKYKKAWLEVRPDNVRAIRAYEKCGFKSAGLREHPENKNLPVTLRMVM